jgi:hypothetical protein
MHTCPTELRLRPNDLGRQPVEPAKQSPDLAATQQVAGNLVDQPG